MKSYQARIGALFGGFCFILAITNFISRLLQGKPWFDPLDMIFYSGVIVLGASVFIDAFIFKVTHIIFFILCAIATMADGDRGIGLQISYMAVILVFAYGGFNRHPWPKIILVAIGFFVTYLLVVGDDGMGDVINWFLFIVVFFVFAWMSLSEVLRKARAYDLLMIAQKEKELREEMQKGIILSEAGHSLAEELKELDDAT